ncbi:hypothetical protein HUA78_30445 [Myxococcus sp. CA033]|uniref:hypothetical protein n=1 Tax=Myxococcus sp. CA033 TaxID=2741516 RepID=UPI00157A3693|nr:hypothetical protein [Myxococcus sp. CA033]NTX38773.1 hypothetical protein [Myxococcus sp. CA033]
MLLRGLRHGRPLRLSQNGDHLLFAEPTLLHCLPLWCPETTSSQASAGPKTAGHVSGNSSTPAPSLPDLGFEYGVFAAQDFTFGTAKGQIFTDDEDTGNENGYGVSSQYRHLALAMVSEGENTYMKVARVGAISCGDNVCNGFEGELTCPADCTRCGDASCGPLENPTSCPDGAARKKLPAGGQAA